MHAGRIPIGVLSLRARYQLGPRLRPLGLVRRLPFRPVLFRGNLGARQASDNPKHKPPVTKASLRAGYCGRQRGRSATRLLPSTFQRNMNTSPVDAVRWWQEAVGPVAPVGHVLRRFFADRWVRFHSLPDSKRYAETSEEYEELVRRHLTITNELFDPGEEIFIFCSDWRDPESGRANLQQVLEAAPSEKLVDLLANPGVVSPEDDDFHSVRASVATWQPAFFENIVQAAADEKVWGLCFASPGSQSVYCTHDGGMDVFASPDLCVSIAAKFSDWKSSREHGL